MRNFGLSFFFVFFAISMNYGQKNILQIDLSGGGAVPMSYMRNIYMFAGNGYQLNGHIDFFVGKIGLGVAAGYTDNPSSSLFASHIEHKYFEKIFVDQPQSWQTKYMVFGPSFRYGSKKWDINIFAKAGISQSQTPQLMFQKYFFGQPIEIFNFEGRSGEFQYIWNAGVRGMYNINSWLGIQLKADYLSTQFLSQMGYQYSYFNVQDVNNNGIIDDPEYMEAEETYKKGEAAISSLNLSTGLVFKIGRIAGKRKVKMLPTELMDLPAPVVEAPQKEVLPAVVEVIDPLPIVPVTSPIVEDVEKPLEDLHVADAIESKYDAEAAEFLYKAGESYFAVNNFDDAIVCFNKLKSDPNYPRAKYMFALSQCATGNCEAAQKEYKEFAQNYRESDSRTLEIIFASHMERCKRGDLLVKSKENTIIAAENTFAQKEYKVQFVAIKKPDATFPKVAQIGPIVSEFFPKKTVYRYSLEGYTTLDEALNHMKEVRKIGFKDAFIAIYENGVRTNTLYHAKLK